MYRPLAKVLNSPVGYVGCFLFFVFLKPQGYLETSGFCACNSGIESLSALFYLFISFLKTSGIYLIAVTEDRIPCSHGTDEMVSTFHSEVRVYVRKPNLFVKWNWGLFSLSLPSLSGKEVRQSGSACAKESMFGVCLAFSPLLSTICNSR